MGLGNQSPFLTPCQDKSFFDIIPIICQGINVRITKNILLPRMGGVDTDAVLPIMGAVWFHHYDKE